MAKLKNAHIGRPPKYTSPEEMQEKIDAYFEECKGHILKNDEGEPVIDKFGRPIVLDAHPPTVTGLALALGFVSRQSLLTYQGKKSFMDTITRAKARVERYAEERLFDRDGSNGAKFSLQNNFSGWIPEKERAADTPEDRLSDAIDKITAAVRDGG